MIKDYTTGKTRFVQMKISAPDGRFENEVLKGGLTKESALFEAKKYPKQMIIALFDSKE